MTIEPNSEHPRDANSQKSDLEADDDKKEQGEVHSASRDSQSQVVGRSSKPAKSKREIMEEMTRQRFPWDE